MMSWVRRWVELVVTNRFNATKRVGITEISRRIWLFSAHNIKSSESVSQQPTQLIIKLNSSLWQIIVTSERMSCQESAIFCLQILHIWPIFLDSSQLIFFTNFIRWDEPRFETNNTVKEDQWTPIDLQFMNQLWVPNIFIYDLRRLQDTSKPTASIFAKSEIESSIYGTNLYLMKLKFNFNFNFNFYFLFLYKNHEMFSLRITVNIINS